MSASSQPPINFYGSIWGPPLISTFLASAIYGITVLQTFYYYAHYRWDRKSWKILVAVVFVLDTAAMALWMYCMYYYLVTSWGLPENTARDVREFPSEYILAAILTFLVQGFYINTIRGLHAPLLVTLLLVALSVAALGTGLILPVVQIHLYYIQTIVVSPLNHLAFNIARATALGCDIGIVIALCWLLGSRKTGIERTNNMINTIIIFSVPRGVLQAIVQAGEVMSYAIKPNNVYFLPFHVIVSRIYCTSFMATLNSRDYVARQGNLNPSHRRNRVEEKMPPRGVEDSFPNIAMTEHERHPTTQNTAPVLSSCIAPPSLFFTSTQRSHDVENGVYDDSAEFGSHVTESRKDAGDSEFDGSGISSGGVSLHD